MKIECLSTSSVDYLKTTEGRPYIVVIGSHFVEIISSVNDKTPTLAIVVSSNSILASFQRLNKSL